VPGMGDLRGTYRFLAPELVAAGFRVAVMDLRGHGDSDVSFSEYGDVPTAGDVETLVTELGGSAVLVGNSMAAGSAVLVAAQRSELVAGLVLIGPFVRNGKTTVIEKLLLRVAMAPLWAASAWKTYLPKLYAGQRPDDFEAYRSEVVASLRRPGRAKAFSLTTRTNHDPAERRLADVTAPALVVMGEKDPDFPDPEAEANWIAMTLAGDVVLVPEAGHYPHAQRPELVGPAVVGFVRRVTNLRGDGVAR